MSTVCVEVETVDCDDAFLETGVRQPEVMALYENPGYKRCHCWGKYVNSSWSICDRQKSAAIK